MDIASYYPGQPLQLGDEGHIVTALQIALNRVSQIYPAIPKINQVDGTYNEQTKAAVIRFQEIFDLPVDGVIGSETYKKLAEIYTELAKLCELEAQGAGLALIEHQSPAPLKEGDSGSSVLLLQYYLSVIHEFAPMVPEVEMTGVFGPQTQSAVAAFQHFSKLPETGRADKETWDMIFREYVGIANTNLTDEAKFPFVEETTNTLLPSDQRAKVMLLQQMLGSMGQSFRSMGTVPMTGTADAATVNAIKKLQEFHALPVTGAMDTATWKALICLSESMRYAKSTRLTQYPGVTLKIGMRDEVYI